MDRRTQLADCSFEPKKKKKVKEDHNHTINWRKERKERGMEPPSSILASKDLVL